MVSQTDAMAQISTDQGVPVSGMKSTFSMTIVP